MDSKKGIGGAGIIAAILFFSLLLVLMRDRGAGLLSSVLKTALIVGAVLAGVIAVAVAAAIIFVKREDRSKRTEEILSKPLPKFSDRDTAELERKYGVEPADTPDAPAAAHTINTSSSGKFSREAYERNINTKKEN